MQHVLESIEAYNALGVVWSNRDEHAKAHEYLQNSEKLYHSARTARQSQAAPLNAASIAHAKLKSAFLCAVCCVMCDVACTLKCLFDGCVQL